MEGRRGWESTAWPGSLCGAAGWSSRREHQVAAGREAGLHESFMTLAEGLGTLANANAKAALT